MNEPLTYSPSDARALAGLALVLLAFWGGLFLYVVHSAMPYNPVALPFEQYFATRTWAPEGWGFFTRDPREERVSFFVRDARGNWTSASLAPHARARNVFGLNRKSRAQGIEAGMLLTTIPESDWTTCRQSAEACLAAAPVVATMTNTSPQPTLCGEVGLLLRKPLPWAWTRSKSRLTMPARIARIHTSC
jgi:antimicrobial peptide system SdpA family protein